MHISFAKPENIAAYYVGNIIRREGIEDKTSKLKFTENAQKILGALLTKLQEKLSPYVPKNVEYEIPTISILDKAIQDQTHFYDQSLKLATKLYETGQDMRIMPCTLLIVKFTAYSVEHTDGHPALALLTISTTRKSIAIDQTANPIEIQSVDILDEDTIDRVAIWYAGTDQIWVREKKSTANLYWIYQFLQAKPTLTGPKAAIMANKMIKSVYAEITDNQKSTDYRDEIKELVQDNEAITFDQIEKCSTQYIDNEKFDQIKKGIEEKSSLNLTENCEVPSNILEKKIKQFVKTIRITPDLEITLKGNTENVTVSQLPTEQDKEIILKITTNQ